MLPLYILFRIRDSRTTGWCATYKAMRILRRIKRTCLRECYLCYVTRVHAFVCTRERRGTSRYNRVRRARQDIRHPLFDAICTTVTGYVIAPGCHIAPSLPVTLMALIPSLLQIVYVHIAPLICRKVTHLKISNFSVEYFWNSELEKGFYFLGYSEYV